MVSSVICNLENAGPGLTEQPRKKASNDSIREVSFLLPERRDKTRLRRSLNRCLHRLVHLRC